MMRMRMRLRMRMAEEEGRRPHPSAKRASERWTSWAPSTLSPLGAAAALVGGAAAALQHTMADT